MKKAVSVLTAFAVTMALATSALAAEWHPSRAQTGATLANNEVTVTSAAGEKTTVAADNGNIIVTNVANTLDGTSSLDAASNAKMNLVYAAATATKSTSELMGKFSNTAEVTTAIETQIAANKTAKVERLNAQRDELSAKVDQLKADGAGADEISAAEQELAQVDAQISATEAADYDSMDNYEPAALFDVSVSGDMEQMLADGGSVEVSVKVDGITADSDVLALHFMGDVADAEALTEELKNNADAVIDDMTVEVLPCVAGDGMVTLTMTSFSPVMILTRAETEVAVTEPAEQAPATTDDATVEATPAPSEDTAEAASSSNLWIYAIVVVVVVVIAAVVVVTRKKKTTTAGKK